MSEINISSGHALDAGPIIGIVFLLIFILVVIYYIYMSFCLMKIAKKTNTENAWFAWIPILDAFLLVQIAKKPTWWIILFFVPLANVVVYVLAWMGICKILGKQEWLGILMIISPLNLIVPGYLAFSKTAVVSDKPDIRVVNVSL